MPPGGLFIYLFSITWLYSPTGVFFLSFHFIVSIVYASVATNPPSRVFLKFKIGLNAVYLKIGEFELRGKIHRVAEISQSYTDLIIYQ